MTEAELAQALVTSGPAGVGVLVLAYLIKSWLTALRADVGRLAEKVEELESAVHKSSVENAGDRAEVKQRLSELERRVSGLEERGS